MVAYSACTEHYLLSSGEEEVLVYSLTLLKLATAFNSEMKPVIADMLNATARTN